LVPPQKASVTLIIHASSAATASCREPLRQPRRVLRYGISEQRFAHGHELSEPEIKESVSQKLFLASND
jgi:hypothetical protein